MRLADFRQLGGQPYHRHRNSQQLPYSGADYHWHAEGIGLLQTQPDILVQQLDGKAGVELPGNDTPRNLIRRGTVAARSRIDDIHDLLRIESGLHADDDSL